MPTSRRVHRYGMIRERRRRRVRREDKGMVGRGGEGPTHTTIDVSLYYPYLCPTHTWVGRGGEGECEGRQHAEGIHICTVCMHMNMMYKYIYVYIRVGRERRRGVSLYILTKCSTLKLSPATTFSGGGSRSEGWGDVGKGGEASRYIYSQSARL